ncbi:MAG: DUF4296 domain-containing protein [Lewinellaceae bacterium]|nr:DUF4296 domain-containing protein [Saprospiraceae bacterium]MCB9340760.1 DUF4296 domain-containing protein [Lewinellaceae bacterium]
MTNLLKYSASQWVSFQYFPIVKLMAATLLLVGLSGCGKEAAPPIPDEKLIEILTDVHIAEAALEGLNGKAKDSVAIKYYGEIFAIHHVEQADFDTTLAILMRDPEKFGNLYEKVAANLEKMRVDMNETATPDGYE